jgi:ACS family tartrate transporter-like MFS transporter
VTYDAATGVADLPVDVTALERSTMRAVSVRLIPFLFLLYVVSYLDRVNISTAALQMNRDVGLDPAAYGFGAGIFFISYATAEVPSNLILARVGARLWIARIMITWGLIAAAMMFVRGPVSFAILRFLLGVAEAGFFPGIIYYLSGWFPAAARARAVARFAVAIPVSGIVGNPLSAALLGLNGVFGLAGWQWLFLLEGFPAVVLGFVVLRYLTDRPEHATWLNDEQRGWLVKRLEDERTARVEAHGADVRRALSNPIVWQLGLALFLCNAFGLYTFYLWLQQIVQGFSGLDNLQVGIVSAVPSLVAAVVMVVVGANSDRTGERMLHVAALTTVAAVGFVGCALSRSPVVSVIALCVAAAGLLGVMPPFWTLPSKFLTGPAAAGGIALITSIANLAGFVGPYAVGLLKRASGDFRTGFLMLAVVPVLGVVLVLRLRRTAELRVADRTSPSPEAPSSAAPTITDAGVVQ